MKKKLFFIMGLTCFLLILVGCQQNDDDIMTAEQWESEHPAIYESYMANTEMKPTTYGGSEPIDYLEEHPNLKTFYDGYGFSKEYARARGHVYALEDVVNTVRPKGGASCLACKTPDFNVALEKDGIDVNKIDFDEFVNDHPQMEGVSCYDCHRNTPGEIDLTRAHLTDAITQVEDEINPGNLSCAQCHVEYYLDPDTNAVVLPWENGMDTDDMLEYYDYIDFADWEHPSTGTKVLKAQHPEYETYQGSIHDNLGLSCMDCHMPEIAGDDKLKSHHWTSPLKSEEGLRQTCISCHGGEPQDIIRRVEEVQESVYSKTNTVSNELLDYVNRLAAAVEDGDIEDGDLQELRDIHRKAQFKWDFVFVENGEGFHNSKTAHDNLDEASALIKQGVEILEKYDK